jgi:hypothetical protein
LKRWLRRLFRLAFAGLMLLLLAIAVEIALGRKCDLQGQIHSPVSQPREREAVTSDVKNYYRPEDDTFLSFPEWYIVWSYQEKADFAERHLPSEFPYYEAVRQYWSSYFCITRLIEGKYASNVGEQVMLVVIGASFSAEYILKGAYENTIGKLSEWSSGGAPAEEDKFAYRVARQYADSVHVRPFYEFRFAHLVKDLWHDTPLAGNHLLRKWERKLFLTTDYTIEAFYCWVIEKLTHLSYGFEPAETFAWVGNAPPALLQQTQHLKIVKSVSTGTLIVDIPRYQEFTTIAQSLATHDVQFIEIAGNSQIALSVIAPSSWTYKDTKAHQLFSLTILTNPNSRRIVLACGVSALTPVLRTIQGGVATLEHIYDY